ncbi:MAG: Hpt domain-containing protein [Anaerotignum sp.]|nr:Hpt domain-containing protein [Anaerotignum sp.]
MCSKIYWEDLQLVKVFIEDSIKSLEGIEKEILQLEIRWDNIDLHNKIFKCTHKLKNGSSFLGLSGITRVTYEMEFILDILKNTKVTETTELIDILLLCVDFLNEYTKRLCNRLKEYNVSNESDERCFEFSNNLKEDQIFESLRLEHIKFELDSKEGNLKPEQPLEENNGADGEPLENFRCEFTEDVKEQFLVENLEHLEK